MTDEDKNWIDNSTYEQLLYAWRKSNVGNPLFQGDTGEYYKTVMYTKQKQITAKEAVQASKNIGW